MGIFNSTISEIPEDPLYYFIEFDKLPNDIINVIISFTKNKLSDLCLVNKYF